VLCFTFFFDAHSGSLGFFSGPLIYNCSKISCFISLTFLHELPHTSTDHNQAFSLPCCLHALRHFFAALLVRSFSVTFSLGCPSLPSVGLIRSYIKAIYIYYPLFCATHIVFLCSMTSVSQYCPIYMICRAFVFAKQIQQGAATKATFIESSYELQACKFFISTPLPVVISPILYTSASPLLRKERMA